MSIKTHLSDLPSPPNNKTGWPWDEEFKPDLQLFSEHEFYPTVSIITPTLNQGDSIEETIRSVILQNYPYLEYYIVDGGSLDQSIEIIQKYLPWISGWTSEKDSGQSNAINKGFRMCKGQIFNWLCSDDYFAKGALWQVSKFMNENPQIDLVHGKCILRIERENSVTQVVGTCVDEPITYPYLAEIWQPSCFYRTKLIKRTSLLREDLHYCMDRELWNYLRFTTSKWKRISQILSVYRFTGRNKSVIGRMEIIAELCKITKLYYRFPINHSSILRNIWLPLVLLKSKQNNPYIIITITMIRKCITMLLIIIYPKNHVKALQSDLHKYSHW
jgi:glycosyltransferase involved in cell wall biosynthesis